MVFKRGDLIHIPQSVVLYGLESKTASIFINQKPALAIFINYVKDGMSEVVLNGQNWLVKNKEIYSQENTNS